MIFFLWTGDESFSLKAESIRHICIPYCIVNFTTTLYLFLLYMYYFQCTLQLCIKVFVNFQHVGKFAFNVYSIIVRHDPILKGNSVTILITHSPQLMFLSILWFFFFTFFLLSIVILQGKFWLLLLPFFYFFFPLFMIAI